MAQPVQPDLNSDSSSSSKMRKEHPEIASTLLKANEHRSSESYEEALGAFGKAIDMIQQERRLNRTLQLSKARCYRQMGNIRSQQGELDVAMSDFSHAAGIFETLELPEDLAEVLECMGEVELNRGCLEAALPPLRQSVALFRDADQGPRAGKGLVLIAAVLSRLGEDRVAGRRLAEGVDMASRMQDGEVHAEVLKLAAETAGQLGDRDSHVEYLERCIAIQGALLADRESSTAKLSTTDTESSAEQEADQNPSAPVQVPDIEALIEEKNEELRLFTRKAAHDMKEPLRMIKSFGGLLKRQFEEGDSSLEYVEYMLDAGDRMQGLLDKLLEYAKVGIAEAEASAQDMSDAVLMATADKRLAAFIKEKNALVEAGDLPQITAHREYLVQAFVHLIHNAILYNTSEQPAIRIEKAPEGNGVIITDNGIGIEEAHQAEIFEIFRRLHSRSEYPGSGIGLATVWKVAEFYNSEISVLKSEPGKGTTFLWTWA